MCNLWPGLAYVHPKSLQRQWSALSSSQLQPCKLLNSCCRDCRAKALVRIQNKENSSSAATSSSAAEFLTTHDYSWMVKAMDQLGIARQVGVGWGFHDCAVVFFASS